MKKLFLLLLLISFYSCAAQEATTPVFPKGEMEVLSIVASTATIRSAETGHTFTVDANPQFKVEHVYFFILEVNGDNPAKVKPALVRYFEIAPSQAAKNIRENILLFNPKNLKQ